MANETLIAKHMKNLNCTREEAITLIAEDIEVDRMKKTSEIDGDLSLDQRKDAKKARQSERNHATVYKFDTSNKKKSKNTEKQFLIETLRSALDSVGCNSIEVTNIEREIAINFNNTKYKIILSAPRS